MWFSPKFCLTTYSTPLCESRADRYFKKPKKQRKKPGKNRKKTAIDTNNAIWYNQDIKGVAGKRLAHDRVKKITASLDWGGYFRLSM